MKKYLLFIGCCLSMATSWATDLVSANLIKTFTQEEMKALWKKKKIPTFIAPIQNDFEVYDVVYYTQWHDGTQIKASGIYFVPILKKGTKMPLVICHHGTAGRTERHTPFGYNGEEQIYFMFATDGYAVLVPDYIGLGQGDKYHLYQHADSESEAAVDMLLAIQKFNQEKNIQLNNQLFLTGYSQGGHATLATHQKLQNQYADRFTVTASSPMSGAYDLVGVQGKTMDKPYKYPFYLTYMLATYNEVYQLYPAEKFKEKIYKPEYHGIIPDVFDGNYSLREINRKLPAIPQDLFNAEILEYNKNNPESPITKAFKANSVYDWKPNAPIQFCFCEGDRVVLAENSRLAYKTMRKNGAKHLKLRQSGRKYGHVSCAAFASAYTKMYFDSFRKGSKYGRKGNIFKRAALSLAKLTIPNGDE